MTNQSLSIRNYHQSGGQRQVPTTSQQTDQVTDDMPIRTEDRWICVAAKTAGVLDPES